MTEPIEPGGSNAAPEPAAAPYRMPTAGQSITAHRALAAPATVDRAARTVEVVWSTGARARNYVPALGVITEELDMSPNAVRMDGLHSGQAPVLNTHRRGDARDVLGRITAARLERGRGYRARLQQHGMLCSMSRKGDCWDNAPMESFFATLKRELVEGAGYATRDEARVEVFVYLEGFYNQRRRHTSLGYLTLEQKAAAFQLANTTT